MQVHAESQRAQVRHGTRSRAPEVDVYSRTLPGCSSRVDTSSRGAGRYSTPDRAVGGDDDDDGDGELQGVVMWETNGDNEVVVSRHRWPSQLGRLGGAMGSADGAAPPPAAAGHKRAAWEQWDEQGECARATKSPAASTLCAAHGHGSWHVL